jgi:hypothetical protein
MSIQEISAEQLAERFHHYDHALRADHDRASERDTEAWEEIPHQERSRLVAAAPGVILRSRVRLNGAAEIGMCGNELRNEKFK